jgi:hypothetical protein
MQDFVQFISSPGDYASFRRRKLAVGWSVVAIFLLFGVVVSLIHPDGPDIASDEAAIARIEGVGAEDTVRGHIGPPETSGQLADRKITVSPQR